MIEDNNRYNAENGMPDYSCMVQQPLEAQQAAQPDAPKRHEPGKGRFFAGGFIAGLLVGVLVTGAAFAAYSTANYYAGNSAAVTTTVSSAESDSIVNEATISKIQLLEQFIDQYYYYGSDVTKKQETDGLYSGLLDSLGDPYSEYYNEEEYASLTQETEGIYYGIGAYLSLDSETDAPMVTGVISGTPAERAGLMAGDKIYEVDGENVYTQDLDTVVSKVRGEKGTTVHLTLIREGASDYVEVDVERDEITSPTVETKMLDDGIGYLQITEFDDVTVQQYEDGFKELQDQGMKAMILDLRSNPGGNVTTVTAIAGDILPEGLIFYMEDKYGERTEYSCDGADFDYPLVVLVNGYSASASEILSGAIQDAGVGTIVGTQTFGKGIVQTVFSLKDSTALKLTIANYYTRGGRNINKVGITPDVECELDAEAYTADGTDTQLNKAIEILEDELK